MIIIFPTIHVHKPSHWLWIVKCHKFWICCRSYIHIEWTKKERKHLLIYSNTPSRINNISQSDARLNAMKYHRTISLYLWYCFRLSVRHPGILHLSVVHHNSCGAIKSGVCFSHSVIHLSVLLMIKMHVCVVFIDLTIVMLSSNLFLGTDYQALMIIKCLDSNETFKTHNIRRKSYNFYFEILTWVF